jgi:hypothetical protein
MTHWNCDTGKYKWNIMSVILTVFQNYSWLTRKLWSGWKISFYDSNLSVCKLFSVISNVILSAAFAKDKATD